MTLRREKLESLAGIMRWARQKLGLEMRERHDLETQRNLKRDLTGRRERISAMISSGREKTVRGILVALLLV